MIRFHDRAAWVLILGLMAADVSAEDEATYRQVAGWGEVIDPARDCKVVFDPERDRLKISVPGTPHFLSAEIADVPMSAPRVVQSVYGDFAAKVRVVGELEPGGSKTTTFDPYHGAGLLVWKDARNYLRLERAVGTIHGRSTPYLNYEQRRDGRLTLTQGILISDHPLHLKIERRNGLLRAWHGSNGSKWTSLPDLITPMNDRVEVGVVAINSSRRLLAAELERFQLDISLEPEVPGEILSQMTSKPAESVGERRVSK